MSTHLENLEKTEPTTLRLDDDKYEKVINPDFFDLDDCIILNLNGREDLPSEYNAHGFHQDRTGFEADTNHVHLVDIVKSDCCTYDWLRLGMYILDKWKSALKLKYPQYSFVLVLSFDEDDCVVRFHKKRENEVPWIDIDSIDNFHEGVMVQIV